MNDNFMICDQEEDKQSIKRSMEGGAKEVWFGFALVWGVTIAIVLYKLISD